MLELDQVSALGDKGLPAVKDVSLTVRAGEILGIAGVSGNGQVELAQVLDGTRRVTSGQVRVRGRELANATPAQVMAAGIGRIPEDRHASVVGELSVAQNMALEHLDEFTRGGVVDHRRLRSHAEGLIAAYQIKAKPEDRIRTLSGGNIQKVILARVLERNPQVIVVAQPTRGLDIGATEYVRHKLIEQRRKGAADPALFGRSRRIDGTGRPHRRDLRRPARRHLARGGSHAGASRPVDGRRRPQSVSNHVRIPY